MDLTSNRQRVLENISARAARYSLNLNERVQRGPLRYAGAVSEVYEGTLHPQGTKVAIKVTRSSHLQYEEAITKAFREVHIWSKLRHENIVQLLGIVTTIDSTVSIISDWMTNGNAHDYVQDRKIDPRPLVLGIAKGLEYLHGKQICHGDLKGPNVLVSPGGRALLTDFGLSYLSSSSFSLPVPTPFGGTLRWMAFESVNSPGLTITREADVWAFGMTALELFTAQLPFPNATTQNAIIVQILRVGPVHPTDNVTCSRMTDEWWNLCLRCWNHEPTSRPLMADIVNEIEIMMRTAHGLEGLSVQATGYCINLNDKVDRDQSFSTDGTPRVSAYLGTLRPKGLRVFIKAIQSIPLEDKEAIKCLLSEVQAFSKLHHENIIPPIGIVTKFTHTVSVVYEWNNKGNAYDYVQSREIDPRPLILGIAQGLEFLHNCEQGPKCHGDIRGSNVLISDDRRALLRLEPLINYSSSHLTLNQALRPQDWSAPENINLEVQAATWQADVWSFGMTMLELFTAKPPFHDVENVNRRIIQGPPDRPADKSTCSRITDEWWEICCLCWERDPSLRPSMASIVAELKSLMVNVPLDRLSELADRQGINFNHRVYCKQLCSHDRFGFVYKGTIDTNNKTVAIRTLHSKPPNNTEVVEYTFQKLRLWSKLRHRNIVPVLGMATTFHGTVSVISEWMERGTAHDFVQDRKIDPRPLILDIAKGLKYLHNHRPAPVYHDNLSGHNVLISHNGRALLGGFGLSQLLNRLTPAMRASGPLNWTAREQLEHTAHASTGEADMWAFGMTILELFTAKPPFHHIKTNLGVKVRILQGPPDRPTDASSHFPMTDDWWRLCSQCWECDLSRRPSAHTAVKRIQTIFEAAVPLSGKKLIIYTSIEDRKTMLKSRIQIVLTLAPAQCTVGIEPIAWKVLDFLPNQEIQKHVILPLGTAICTVFQAQDDVLVQDWTPLSPYTSTTLKADEDDNPYWDSSAASISTSLVMPFQVLNSVIPRKLALGVYDEEKDMVDPVALLGDVRQFNTGPPEILQAYAVPRSQPGKIMDLRGLSSLIVDPQSGGLNLNTVAHEVLVHLYTERSGKPVLRAMNI